MESAPQEAPHLHCSSFQFRAVVYLVCMPLGMAKARRNGTWFDTVTSVIIFSGYVMPGYALGILLIIFLGGGSFLDLFPIQRHRLG